METSETTRPRPFEMMREEYEKVKSLIQQYQPETTLEIGMANGGSAELICSFHAERGSGSHRAIDPFQNHPDHYNNAGVNRVLEAGYSDYFTMINDYSHLAMPDLLRSGERFDMILIDGWHSLQNTFVDIYFADLLLKDGGLMLLHDTYWASVYHCCVYLEKYLNYKQLSPTLDKRRLTPMGRLLDKAGVVLKGPASIKQRLCRRNEWKSLSAYEKITDADNDEHFYAKF